MKVLFDYVMNHVDEESGLYQAKKNADPQWFVPGTPLCSDIGWDNPGTHCGFTRYLPVFDFNNSAARKWSINDALWWAKTYDIDGYRLDAIKHVPLEWLEEFRARFNEEITDPAGERFYLVGETYTWGDYDVLKKFVEPKTRLDGQFDFPFRKEVCEATMGKGSLQNLKRWFEANDTRYGAGAIMSTFLGNHDIPRIIHNASGEFDSCTQGSWPGIAWTLDYTQPQDAWPYEKLALGFAIMMTNPGVPLIYYGDEIGLAGGGDPDNRRMMIWDDNTLNAHQIALRETVQKLSQLRGAHKALTRGTRVTLSVTPDTWVYKMGGCGTAAQDIIVAINRSDATQSVTIPPGSYTHLMHDMTVEGGSLELAPRGFAILRVE